MHILYDTLSISNRKSGVGNYAINLLKNLLKQSKDLKIYLLRQPFIALNLFEDERVIEVPYYSRLLNFKNKYDLFHGLNCRIPFGISSPKIVTIHDMLWFDNPRLGSAFFPRRHIEMLFFRYAIYRAIQHSQYIITISETSRKAIINYFPDKASQIKTIYSGIDQCFFSASNPLILPRKTLDQFFPNYTQYALIYSHNTPNKNHAGMIKAYILALKDKPHHRLVIVRRYKRIDYDLEKLLQRPEVAKKVILFDYVPDAVLLTLLKYAQMLLFISHYEGFGFPMLEAMAMGVPVVASTAPTLKEIAQDGALFAIPTNIDDMAQKIKQLDSNDNLRYALIKKGKKRVLEFKWEVAAKKTLALYHSMLK